MASETTSTTLDDLTQALIAEAYYVESQGMNLSDYILNRQLPKGKDSVLFPKYGAVTVAAVNEATDLANQAVSTSGVTITPGEYGGMTTLTDVADYVSNPVQVGTDIGRLFGEAMRASKNQAIWALFDGFSNSVGTTNTDITEVVLLQAITLLTDAKAPRPYYFAITPYVMEDLMTIYSTNTSMSADIIRNSVLEAGILPPIYGVQPVLVDNLAAGTSAGKGQAADAKCGLFSRNALGYVDGYQMRVELERDASLRANEIVTTSYFGVGEIEGTFGVEILCDNKD